MTHKSCFVAVSAVATVSAAMFVSNSARSEGKSSETADRNPVLDIFAELETGAKFPRSIIPPIGKDDKGMPL